MFKIFNYVEVEHQKGTPTQTLSCDPVDHFGLICVYGGQGIKLIGQSRLTFGLYRAVSAD